MSAHVLSFEHHASPFSDNEGRSPCAREIRLEWQNPVLSTGAYIRSAIGGSLHL